jgi:hypothetical protein
MWPAPATPRGDGLGFQVTESATSSSYPCCHLLLNILAQEEKNLINLAKYNLEGWFGLDPHDIPELVHLHASQVCFLKMAPMFKATIRIFYYHEDTN